MLYPDLCEACYKGKHSMQRLISYYSYCKLADKPCLPHGMCLYQAMMTLHFLNDIANDAELTQKFDHYVIFVSLKSGSTW